MQPGFYLKCGSHFMGFTLGFSTMWAHTVSPELATPSGFAEINLLKERAAQFCPHLPLKIVEVCA